MKRLLLAAVAAAACAFSALAQPPPPKKEFVDAFFLAFRHFLAITSAGVDECGNRFPERREEFLAAYERARAEHLDVFAKAESSEDYAGFLSVERSFALAAKSEDMTDYCTELPRFIDVVANYAVQLRVVLLDP